MDHYKPFFASIVYLQFLVYALFLFKILPI